MIEPTDEMRRVFREVAEHYCDCDCDDCLDERLAAVLAIVERDLLQQIAAEIEAEAAELRRIRADVEPEYLEGLEHAAEDVRLGGGS